VDALYAAPADRRFVTAWIDEDEQENITFGDFRRRSELQAALLQKNGVGAGDCVVLIMPQGIPLMTAFAGCLRLGAVPAILAYPNFKVEASKYRFGLTGVTANLRARVVVIDDEFPEDLLDHVAFSDDARLLRASRCAEEAKAELPEPDFAPDSLAFIQHSAGTTGLQKGVALTHAAVLQHLEHLQGVLRIDGQADSVYSWLPLYHDMGLIACFMLPMVCHMPVVMQSPLDWVMHPETMLQIFTDHRCTLSWLPNFAFQFVPRRTPRERWSGYDLSSARALINCSEPVRASSMNEFYEAFAPCGLRRSALQVSYAMAENVFAVTQSGIDHAGGPETIWAHGRRFRGEHFIAQVAKSTPGAVPFTSSGRVLPGNEVRIVSDGGDLLDAGFVGEIAIRSDSLFQGYYNRPDLTEEVLRDGWYYTGDLGFLLNGELFVVGRKKDLLIIGGENFYPQDIEEIVCGHPSIHDGRAIALGLFNPESGTEDIVVIAEVEDERHLRRASEIEGEIRSRVVAGMGVAVRQVFVKPPKWIVKSTAGKPARSTTREKLLQEHPTLAPEALDTQNDN
jgi:acyl-CoA synthetase (AMP-forming)/AMP-acid ligase II